MDDTKAKSSISTEVIKEFIDEFTLLSEKNQILVVGMIKGIAAVNDIDTQKKGA
jgi:hypothetical protein